MGEKDNNIHYIFSILGAIVFMYIAKYEEMGFLSSIILGVAGIAAGLLVFAIAERLGNEIGKYYDQLDAAKGSSYAFRIKFIIYIVFVVMFSAIMFYA